MILVLTNKEDLTVDYVIDALLSRGENFLRINTEDLPNKVTFTDFIEPSGNHTTVKINDDQIKLSDISSVYFRRPGIPEADEREIDDDYRDYINQEWNEILTTFYTLIDATWINHPYQLIRAENKPHQLRLAKSVGFTIPGTLISNCYDDLIDFYRDYGQFVIKSFHSSLLIDGTEQEVAFTNRIKDVDNIDPDSLHLAPVICQEFIEKDFDLRVTVVGDNTFSTLIDSQEIPEARVDWRAGEEALNHEEYSLPNELARKCASLVNKLGLKFGAIDLAVKDGNYYFLEINPNGQWAWLEERLDHNISAEIASLLGCS